MPVLIGADAIVVLAFAIAGLSAALLIRSLVIDPTRSASVAVSGAPLVGGILAWGLSQLANLMDSSLRSIEALKQSAINDGINTWNWMVYESVQYIYSSQLGLLSWLGQMVPAVLSTLNWVTAVAVPQIWVELGKVEAAASSLYSTVNWIVHVALAQVWAEIGKQQVAVSGLSSTLNWVTTVALGDVWRQLGVLGGRTGTLEQWAGQTATQTLPRIVDDIGRRALEEEAVALRARVNTLEKSMAVLWALSVIAIAGADAIENLRCLANTPCDPLNQLLNGDLDARVTELEVGNG